MTTKAAIADLMKRLQARHTKRYNCVLGKKRCSKCDIVALTEKFIDHSSVCRVCYSKCQKAYYECRVAAQVLKTGVPRNPPGRPFNIKPEPEPVEVPKTRKKTIKKK